MKIPRIFIDKKGRWFQNGVRITHRWTYLENNRNLRVSKKGGFEVLEGEVAVPVEVEDTPFVIVSAEIAESGIAVKINDGTAELLSEDSVLTVNTENVPYAQIKQGVFKARFMTGAYYAIASAAEPLPGGGFVVQCAGRKYRFLPEQ